MEEEMESTTPIEDTLQPALTLEDANKLAQLPLACMQTEYPNKLNQVIGSGADVQEPKALHPAFYGCFDWHSSVHGHWSLVSLLKRFPDLDSAEVIREKLAFNMSPENIRGEIDYFSGPMNGSFERTYGWAWLLKLAEELYTWEDSLGRNLYSNLKPLSDLIADKYIEFLPKLVYPIRVGEHTNTAFGLTFAWDYANTVGNNALKELIESRARDWYMTDYNCPITWEPSGYDFLSPCLEEADLMRRVLPADEFNSWLTQFLVGIDGQYFSLDPGIVSDRTDGKLVHLDGLNFSRAWCLYGLANSSDDLDHLRAIANAHMDHSLGSIVDGNYEGQHWLASFALYAYYCSED